MKKVLSLVVICLFAVVSNAQPPDVPADKGAKFGADIVLDNPVTVETMLKNVNANDGKKTDVRVIGEVVEVCQMSGCWLKLKNGNDQITVKMKGHKWYVPSALVGKMIILEGVAELKTTSVDELKHYADDAGKSKEEVDAIKEPKVEVVVVANGIVVA